MNNNDLENLETLARAIIRSGLNVTATVAGDMDDYEVVTYIDSVVVEDSMGNEVLVINKEDVDG